MKKQIQIDEILFLELYRLLVLEEDNQELTKKVKQQLEMKLEKMISRNLYTKYKTAPTEEEREQARQEYLEQKGIHKDWRW